MCDMGNCFQTRLKVENSLSSQATSGNVFMGSFNYMQSYFFLFFLKGFIHLMFAMRTWSLALVVLREMRLLGKGLIGFASEDSMYDFLFDI